MFVSLYVTVTLISYLLPTRPYVEKRTADAGTQRLIIIYAVSAPTLQQHFIKCIYHPAIQCAARVTKTKIYTETKSATHNEKVETCTNENENVAAPKIPPRGFQDQYFFCMWTSAVPSGYAPKVLQRCNDDNFKRLNYIPLPIIYIAKYSTAGYRLSFSDVKLQ